MTRKIVGYWPDKKTEGMFGRVPGLPIYEDIEEREDTEDSRQRDDTRRVQISDNLGKAASMRQEPGTRVYGLDDSTSGSW